MQHDITAFKAFLGLSAERWSIIVFTRKM